MGISKDLVEYDDEELEEILGMGSYHQEEDSLTKLVRAIAAVLLIVDSILA